MLPEKYANKSYCLSVYPYSGKWPKLAFNPLLVFMDKKNHYPNHLALDIMITQVYSLFMIQSECPNYQKKSECLVFVYSFM